MTPVTAAPPDTSALPVAPKPVKACPLIQRSSGDDFINVAFADLDDEEDGVVVSVVAKVLSPENIASPAKKANNGSPAKKVEAKEGGNEKQASLTQKMGNAFSQVVPQAKPPAQQMTRAELYHAPFQGAPQPMFMSSVPNVPLVPLHPPPLPFVFYHPPQQYANIPPPFQRTTLFQQAPPQMVQLPVPPLPPPVMFMPQQMNPPRAIPHAPPISGTTLMGWQAPPPPG